MKKCIGTRILSLLLVLSIFCGFAVPVDAQSAQSVSLDFQETDGISAVRVDAPVEEDIERPQYAPDEVVRVSIVLDQKSTLEAGFTTMGIAQNAAAMTYRDGIRDEQVMTTARIEKAVGEKLDVQWNLTLAANIISANVAYGDIEAIQAVPGVKEVFLETQYQPCMVDREEPVGPHMATSREMIGTSAAYASGYTGAGSRVAIIDTGLDMDHQSFSAAGYEHSLGKLAESAGMTLEQYQKKLHVLTAQEISSVLDQLNVTERTANITGERLYKTSKVAFGYNYVDQTDTYLDHDQDGMGGHGSHVAGIAAANSYLANQDGSFSTALEEVAVQGVAPDAQLLVMKVFGVTGGAYDSDYMAAIEDAIVLGCDSVNLSLGSPYPGFSRVSAYEELLDNVTESGTMVVISAGNSGHWAEYAFTDAPGYLYADDVSMQTSGSPGTYTNSMGVASADNVGSTGYYFTVDGNQVFFAETEYLNVSLATLAGQQGYIFLDGFGTEADFAAVGDALQGKVAFCSRGECSFYEKAEAAVRNGAIATVIYNNEPGAFYMDLNLYSQTNPCVAITQADAGLIRNLSTPVKDDEGNILYYTGTMEISGTVGTTISHRDFNTISSFSSYGVPGSLEMKPEITAPGGSIYSVDGESSGGTSYVTMSGTSMAAPQIAGMAALVGQYIRETGLEKTTGLKVRTLAQSLLMSTAAPMLEEASGNYYPVLRQGAGLANVGSAIAANSYILMDENATASGKDGKVKVELKDDPQKTGVYEFGFTLYNLEENQQLYSLSADLFTQDLFEQDGYTWLDTQTTDLACNVTWTADGKTLTPNLDADTYDVTGDKLVNGEDVQAILDYVIGAREAIGENADLNGDGEVTSYDAYLLLEKLNTGLVTLPGNGKLEISVKVELTEAQKAEFHENYPKGAYVEGFLYASQMATAEGVRGTVHSIPLLGFYGNWTDPSMFDHSTYIGRFYGDTQSPYVPDWYDNGSQYIPVEDPTKNSLTLLYDGEIFEDYHIGNPYGLEDSYPAGREAISPKTAIFQQRTTLIRNAAVTVMVVRDQNGRFLYMGEPTAQDLSAFYYENAGYWKNISTTSTVNRTVESLGAKPGDTITVSMVAIPELYVTGDDMTVQQIQSLIASDVLGDGAYMSSTFLVDDQAPEILSVSKDLLTGSLTIAARDNHYIATVQVLSPGGSKVYGTAVPTQTQEGDVTYTTIDLAEANIGPECLIVVGDYAKNETAYTVSYGGEPEDLTGKIYGFTSSNYRGSGPRCVNIDPENLWYYKPQECGGLENVQSMNIDITAAEYVDGYIYMAATDGYLYVGQQGSWSSCRCAGYYGDTAAEIRDMAFNYQNGALYALDAANNLYTVDLISAELTKVANVTVTNPATSFYENKKLTMLAIDDYGNFYVVNRGTFPDAFLYRFTLDDIVDGKITDLPPVVNERTGRLGFYTAYGSLAWDHDRDILYMSGSAFADKDSTSTLVTIDPETAVATKVTDQSGGHPNTYASRLYTTVCGLYIVPSSAGPVEPSTEATAITLDQTEVTALSGTEFTLEARVYPWNLTDSAVTWVSSDETVAQVTDGKVVLTGAGTATVTATTHAAPHLSTTCTVTAEKLADTKLSALIRDEEGSFHWSEFETDHLRDWKPVSGEASEYYGGVLKDDTIFVHDGSTVYGVDADTFEMTNFGGISESWIWSDAAAAPAVGTLFDRILTICMSGKFLALVDPVAGQLRHWDLSSELGEDAMAALAYADTGVYDYYGIEDCPAHFYYMITESGCLWKVTLLAFDNGETYVTLRQSLGNTGLKLTDVSAAADDSQSASMVYDGATGYLLLSTHQEGESSRLYAIHPETLLTTKLGDFGDHVGPVASLYQYDRISELTVKMKTTAATLYAGETLQLTARVLPMDYASALSWSSSDASVATVDENGFVTARKEGTAVITATSVDVDDTGKHASASCEVAVKGLTQVSFQVGGQIVTDGGAQWITIDTGSMATTVNAQAETVLTGAGVHNGKIYGTNSNFTSLCNIYQVDPDNSFAESMGSICIGDHAFHDVTTAPAETVTLTDYDGEEVTLEAFGFPVLITHSQYLVFLTDYAQGSLQGFRLDDTKGDLGALAYVGDGAYEDWYGNQLPGKVFYGLGADGTMYQFLIYVSYDGSAQAVAYSLVSTALGNIGMTFEDLTAMTMTYVHDGSGEGLIIGYNHGDGAALYYVDLSADTLSCGKIGEIPGANAISGLYVEEAQTSNASLIFREATDEVCSVSQSFAYGPTEAKTAEELSLTADQVAGSTNAVVTQNTKRTADEADGKTITLEVTAKNAEGVEVAATNGVATVEFNSEKLELVHVAVHADYRSLEIGDGTVQFAYANREEIAAGQPVAILTLQAKPCVSTDVSITHHQINEKKLAYEETVLVTAHEVELRNHKEATCTEAGYTGDEVCTACGEILKQGEEIPALGHKTEVKNAKAPTCTEDGYTGDLVCLICGEILEQGEAIPAHCASKEFTDLDTGCWYHVYTDYVLEEGLMQGMGNGIFAPHASLSRGMLVTTLYRLAGEPEVLEDSTFTDVAKDQYFSKAVAWAEDNGIAKGMTATTFAPDRAVTREQAATFLYRYVTGYLGKEPVEGADLNAYRDGDQVSEFARTAMAWTAAECIFEGYGDTTLRPRTNLTRAQMAKLLTILDQNF